MMRKHNSKRATIVGQNKQYYYNLPTELLHEILAKLPAKTLLRLRCVCKSWQSLISSPNFISMHLTLFNNNNDDQSNNLTLLATEINYITWRYTLFINLYSRGTCTKTAKAMKLTKRGYIVCGYMNSVVLFTQSKPSRLLLFNLSIRKSLQLPDCPFTYHEFDYGHHFALGFDLLSHDFNLVVVAIKYTYSRSKFPSLVATYWLLVDNTEGFWKTTSINVDDVCIWNFERAPIFSKGAIHWQVCDKVGYPASHVASFDLANEAFNFVQLPHEEETKLHFLFLLGQSLAVLGVSPLRSYVWVMGRESSWIKWCSIDLPSIYDRLLYIEPVHLAYDEKVGKLLISKTSKVVISYDVKKHEIEDLMTSRSSNIYSVYPYVESLVLLNGLDYHTLAPPVPPKRRVSKTKTR